MNIIKKIKSIPPSVKASMAYFIASVFSSGIAYITTPIYTRLLSAEEYGQTAIFFTWLQIFGIVAMFCLSYGVFNNGMLDYPDKRDEYSFSMLILSNIITLCFSGVLLALYPLVKQFIGLSYALIILMCIVFLLQPAYNFWVSRQRYELKYKLNLLWSVLFAIFSPLVSILCILFTKDTSKLYARIFGAEAVLIVGYIGFYIYLAVKSKFKINVKFWKFAFLFNLPLIFHYLSMYLLSSSDKIMISYLIDDAATAYYSVAHSIAGIALMIWSAINGVLVPYTYKKCQTKSFEDLNKLTLPIIFIFSISCFLVIMMAPEVLKIMATDDYYEAIYVIPPIIGGVFFQIQYDIYANVIYFYKKSKYVMIGSTTAIVFNIVLNYFFIKRFGYVAAGYTTIFCYGIQAMIDYIAMRKIAKTKIYDIRLILLLSAFVTAVACLSPLIYDYWIARYSIVLVILILLVIFRKKIIGLFAALKKTDESKEQIPVIETEQSNQEEPQE